MNKLLFFLLLFLLSSTAFSQFRPTMPVGNPHQADNWIITKNYYLLSLLADDNEVAQLIGHDPELKKLTQTKLTDVQNAVTDCKILDCDLQALKFSSADISMVSSRLRELYQPTNALGRLVSTQLIPSSAYSLYANSSASDLLIKAWEQDAAGINYTIDVYAGGKKPNYPLIDSISFNTAAKSYLRLVYDANVVLVKEAKDNLYFFQPSLNAALLFLQLNERHDPANDEPLAATANKAAVSKAAAMNWGQYPYTLILVPGAGPEDLTTPLSAEGMLRCRLAVAAYKQGQAPFIMVSGGNVHPFKTRYNEAEEMKKYLVHTMNVPESAVIIEPHARHTTTNMRNAVRLMYRYHFPPARPALVITDKSQQSAILKMAARCEKELHYVPYKLGKPISDTQVEFYMLKEAFQINPLEPLDP